MEEASLIYIEGRGGVSRDTFYWSFIVGLRKLLITYVNVVLCKLLITYVNLQYLINKIREMYLQLGLRILLISH